MLDFRIAQGCLPTGRLLQKLCGTPKAGRTGIVCWGRSYTGTEPALNKRAGSLNKLQQLQKLKSGGVLTPPIWEHLPTAASDFPVLGRHLHHVGGRDITLILQPMDALKGHSDYYTKLIPMATEFRTWIYRTRHLGTYEKRLTNPSRYKRVGANWANGFTFHLLQSEQVPETLRNVAAEAIDALGLDFGAVDILRGLDGRLYVLEVNTAPGVEGENRQVVQALATKIRTWETLNFPRRNGDAAHG